jgi:hypothetical protein
LLANRTRNRIFGLDQWQITVFYRPFRDRWVAQEVEAIEEGEKAVFRQSQSIENVGSASREQNRPGQAEVK